MAALNGTVGLIPNLTATVVSDGLPPWYVALNSPAWWFFSIFACVCSCAVSGLAFIRMWQHYRATGEFRLSVPMIVLALELVGGFSTYFVFSSVNQLANTSQTSKKPVRFLYWGIDPFGHRGILPFAFQSTWRSLPIPFSIASLLVLVFYWHETTSTTSLKFSWSIEAFKIPCYTTIAITFILEAISHILYYTGAETYALWLLVYALPVYYLILGLSVGLFYLTTSIRILVQLAQLHRRNNNSSSKGSTSSERSASKDQKQSKAIRVVRSVFGGFLLIPTYLFAMFFPPVLV